MTKLKMTRILTVLSIIIVLTMATLPILTIKPVFATDVTVQVDPATSYVTLGTSFTVAIDVTNVSGLTSWQFKLYYENAVLTGDSVAEGGFLKTSGGSTFFGYSINNTYSGTQGCILAYDTLQGAYSASGSGTLATVTFYALGDGVATLHLSETKLGDTAIPPNPIAHTDVDGAVTVQSFTLTVDVVGTGCTVTLDNNGYDGYYHQGEIVTLTANPAAGYSFSGFTGDLVSSTSPASITITKNEVVTATFNLIPYSLTVTYSGTGSGLVSTDQSTPFYYGEVVTFTATPSTNSSFAGWSGALSGTATPQSITITGDVSVTATFNLIPYVLSITTTGSGTVLTDKSPPYYYGYVVTLTATPSAGWSFQYWTVDGGAPITGNVTTITMTADHSVTANFINTPTLSMSPTSRMCRVYHESFTVTISISSAANFNGYAFEVDYDTTMLSCQSVTCSLWGSSGATVNIDPTNGKITVSNSGTATSGTQTLVTITFWASVHHIFTFTAGAPTPTNNLTSTIYFNTISVSYPTGPPLQYTRGDQTQISVGPDFAYKFVPIQGDLNNDGVVDIFDLRTVAAYIGGTYNPTYDLNNDGRIDVADLQIVAYNYDFHYTIPPP